jgi:hypothetical protein
VELDELALKKVQKAVEQAEEKARGDLATLLKQAEERAMVCFEQKMTKARELLKRTEENARHELEKQKKEAEEKARQEVREQVGAVRQAVEEEAAGDTEVRRAAEAEEAAAKQTEWDEDGGFALNAAARVHCVSRWRQEAGETSDEQEENELQGGALIRVDYKVLRWATNDFSQQHLIGKGGCCKVYKATVYGHECAVKVFNEAAGQEAWDNKQIKTEIAMLTSVRHPHINRLLAASFNGPRRCLLLEYMGGGALDTRLCSQGKAAGAGSRLRFEWVERASVLLHTARGLVHLHSFNPPIIHRDVKVST